MAGIFNDIMWANNVDFTGAHPPTAQMVADGQLLIGSSISPFLSAATLTSTGGTVTITNGHNSINLDITGGGVAVQSFHPNSGTDPVVPTAGGLVNVLGTGSTTVVGSLNTLTVQLTGLTDHAIQIGAGTATLTQLGPGTTGQVLQTNTGANPTWSTATYPSSTTINQLLYSSSNNTVAGLSSANKGVLTTGATGIPVITALAADGQLIIGSTAGAPAAATLTAGTGISITNGSNSISIAVNGAVVGETITGQSGGALSPTAGNWNISGAVAAAGTSPVVTSGAVSTLTVNVQTSQAIAAADATKIGLSNFDSSSFAVAATGFVTLSTTGVGKTITGDSGGALSPTANNWNILGLSGSKTSGSGSTLTIKSPPFVQVGSSATSSLNTGEFVTAAVTRTLPVSAGLADGDLFIYSCTTAGALVIQAVGAQKIRIGTLLSSAAGTATSTAIGDSITLRFDATQGFFMATSVIGTWVLA